MDDLVQAIENFLVNLDGQNYEGFVEEESQYSNVDFVMTGYDYERNSANITDLTISDFDSDSQIAEFEVTATYIINALFEGDDYSEASHDSEDDEWYNVEAVSEEHKYSINLDLTVSVNFENNTFEVTTPTNSVHIDVNIENFVEE